LHLVAIRIGTHCIELKNGIFSLTYG